MPTDTGAETIGERLTRLRADLARVRQTIARSENNGADAKMGLGIQITQIAYDRAVDREKEIASEIRSLEARLTGGAGARVAILRTSSPGS